MYLLQRPTRSATGRTVTYHVGTRRQDFFAYYIIIILKIAIGDIVDCIKLRRALSMTSAFRAPSTVAPRQSISSTMSELVWQQVDNSTGAIVRDQTNNSV